MTIKSKKSALVTGGAGFIGSHMSEALIRQGYTVTCLDNFSTGSWKNIEHIPGLRVIEGNVNHAPTLKSLEKEKFDVVFHYAATVGVRRTEENPFTVLEDAKGFDNIVEFMRNGGGHKIVFASSSEVYANLQTMPMREEDGHIGWSPYTVVKLYGEEMLRALWQKHNIPAVSLRFFNVYGPRQAGNGYGFVVAKFVQQALQDVPLTVYGDGQQTRDFVYIGDNIAATLVASNESLAFGQTINIGTGQETKIYDLAHTIIKTAGKEKTLTPSLVAGRKFEIPRRRASTKRMHRLLHTSCPTTLANGLKKTVGWYSGRGKESVLERVSKKLLPHIDIRHKLA